MSCLTVWNSEGFGRKLVCIPRVSIEKQGYEQILLMFRNPMIILIFDVIVSTNALQSVTHSADAQELMEVETRLEFLICPGFLWEES